MDVASPTSHSKKSLPSHTQTQFKEDAAGAFSPQSSDQHLALYNELEAQRRRRAYLDPAKLDKLAQQLHSLRVKCDARGMVDCFDELNLYSEKIRRIQVRVSVRSNRQRKKACLRMMKEFVLV